MRCACVKGSEWRKWDLHLHAPGTKLNDQFTAGNREKDTWDEYCTRLHQSDVQVFGITDYFSADTYFTAKKNYRVRYPDSTKVFFCNIELRISESVNNAVEEVNLHLIFNTSQNNHKQKITSFLQCLKTNTTDSSDRELKASELATEAQFKAVTTTRGFIRQALEETLGRDADITEHLLIGAAANNDGIRARRGAMRKQQIALEIDKFSHFFFGNSNNVDYFLAPDRRTNSTESLNAKPVLSGSDAHSFVDLESKLGKVKFGANGVELQPTWIKADPTYEGLRQIIFEPRERVFIGKEPRILDRVRNDKTKYIEALEVTNIESYSGYGGRWFKNEEILFGTELVSIIGNKGSGKSALTDIIGLLGNSQNQILSNTAGKSKEMFSFLNSEKFLRKKLASNFEGKIRWRDGTQQKKNLSDGSNPNLPENVEYLPQKYLERICADISDNRFRKKLNSVVFRYVARSERYGKSSLEDLIDFLTKESKTEIEAAVHELRLANEAVVSIEKKLVRDYQEKIKGEMRLKEQELAAHLLTRPTKPPERQQRDSTEGTRQIETLTRQIAQCTKVIGESRSEHGKLLRRVEELRQVRQAIRRETQNLMSLASKFAETLGWLQLSFDDVVRVDVDYSRIDQVLSDSNDRIALIKASLATEEDIIEMVGDQPNQSEAELAAKARSIVCKRAVLQEQKARLVERQGKSEREYQEYLIQNTKWNVAQEKLHGNKDNPSEDSLLGLQMELDKIKEVYPQDLDTAKRNQVEASKQLFRKRRALTRIYEQIKESISTEIAKLEGELGDYTISVEAGLRFDRSFFEKFLDFINQARKGSFYGLEEGRARIREYCDHVDDWENEDEVFRTLDEIIQALHVDNRDAPNQGQKRNIFTQMKNQETPVVDLYDYLFGFTYLVPRYDLKINQRGLSELSPGERGALLLVFYLVLDKQSTPLIIDQPEDNLDNKSVYQILVHFLKRAKKRRQIILVTHNPNLAIVSDSEQIIHVSIDKRNNKYDFDFYSGSIEAPRINHAVVDILEGTLPAFDNRRLKYRRPK